MLKRELREQARSHKLFFAVLFIIGGALMSLYTEAGPVEESGSVLGAFFDLFHVLCPFLGILMAMDAIVGEKERGTLEWVGSLRFWGMIGFLVFLTISQVTEMVPTRLPGIDDMFHLIMEMMGGVGVFVPSSR